MTLLAFLIALSIMAFAAAAASLLAERLERRRDTELPPLGKTRVGLDHINAPARSDLPGA